MMQKRSLCRWIRVIAFAVVFFLILSGFTLLLRGKWLFRTDNQFLVTTSWVDEFYEEAKDTIDVISLGTSHSYRSFNPLQIWHETGITAYNLGSSSQILPVTRLYLREVLKTQSPKVVMLEMLGVTMPKFDSEGNAHKALDCIPLSWLKLKAISQVAARKSEIFEYLFPILRYHARWSDLKKSDFTYFFRQGETHSLKGYAPFSGAVPVSLDNYGKKTGLKQISAANREALDAITEMCGQAGAELVLWSAPSPKWRKDYSNVVQAYAQEKGLTYLDLNQIAEEVGIDVNADFADQTNHLNQYGAEKVTHWLTTYLKSHFQLADRRGDSGLKAAWDYDYQVLQQQQIMLLLEDVTDRMAYLKLLTNPEITGQYLTLVSSLENDPDKLTGELALLRSSLSLATSGD